MEKILKIILIGDPTVGKTSFVNRYAHNTFRRDYKGTIGVDFTLKVINWSEDLTLKLQIWDIAGQERFTSMTRVYYKDAHACIIMFDLTSKESFENAARWKADLDSKCTLADGTLVPCILLANKCDLQHRDVTQAEIERFTQDQAMSGFAEISVKENIMIEESMKFLLQDLVFRFAESPVKKPARPGSQGGRDKNTIRLSQAASPRAPTKQDSCSC